MSILDKIAENADYSENFRKMSIWVQNSKYLEFDKKFPKKSGFSLKFSKILTSVKIAENVKFRKILILVKIHQNVDFGHNWRKYWF